MLGLVAEQGLWPVGIGLTIGILAELLLARFIEAFLYGVSAYDPVTLALTVLVLGIATLIALLCILFTRQRAGDHPGSPEQSW